LTACIDHVQVTGVQEVSTHPYVNDLFHAIESRK
jgi:hypothetical protein